MEAREIMSNIAVILFDGVRKVFPWEMMIWMYTSGVACPVIRQHIGVGTDHTITYTATAVHVSLPQVPAQYATRYSVDSTPEPDLLSFFLMKWCISSTMTISAGGATAGSGRASAAARTHL